MSLFNDVKLSWDGNEYVVPSNQVMMLIARVEEQITLAELIRPKGAPLARIAMGYAAALRYAGCKVKDEEVYAGMFAEGSASEHVQSATTGLLMMMIPPDTGASGKKKTKSSRAK